MATPAQQPQKTSGSLGRSIVAVLAGMIAGAILSIGTDVLMNALGILPPLGQPAGDNPLP